MSRRILIASTNPWSFCMAVERDIIRRNPEARIDVLNMWKLCSVEAPEWRRVDHVIEQANRNISRFVAAATNGDDITDTVRVDHSAVPSLPVTHHDLRYYRPDGAGVGMAVLSSVTSITTVQEPTDLTEYGDVFPKAWKAAHLSLQIGKAVRGRGYDEAYVFNGRHAYSRPFCDVMERTSRMFRYEQGSKGNSYVIADRSIQHPSTTADLIRRHEFDRPAGEQFYRDRVARAPGDAVNFFTATQVKGHIPETFEPGSVVAFFTSSSDEMFAITDDLGFGSFPTQNAAALALADVAKRHRKRFVIRFHPHLQYKHHSWRREWDFERLRAAGAVLIGPGDPCDSYALAGVAHCVFTCGSTVGFECTYRGIPNADLGLWLGGHLGVMHYVLDEAEMDAFVRSPRLPEGAREQALMYGSYGRRSGREMPELEVGSHPYFARIGGQIADPVRYVFQKLRGGLTGRTGAAKLTPESVGGTSAGKVILDPNLKFRATDKADLENSTAPASLGGNRPAL